MKLLDLFSGIGGFSLAARWAGIETVAFCEIDKYCCKVLNKNFPGVKIYGNIKELNGKTIKDEHGSIDIITGGFPCQPFSVAGKRKGKEDDRHLWPEIFRIIREVKPAFVICENVPGIINMELEQVLADMESEKYTVETFIIPACAINAPHRRDRVWIIAYSNSINDSAQKRKIDIEGEIEFKGGYRLVTKFNRYCKFGVNPDSDSQYFKERRSEYKLQQESKEGTFGWSNPFTIWDEWTVEPPLCGVDARVPKRMDRIKGLGNAIVPQLAFIILQAIKNIHEEINEFK
jgi:DNA (cytosine-5)-methyltransferase 1